LCPLLKELFRRNLLGVTDRQTTTRSPIDTLCRKVW
jgi:hypothetical protein